MARERLSGLKNLSEKEKHALSMVLRDREEVKYTSPSFDRMGFLIVYRYVPRCLYCSDVNVGNIVGGNGIYKIWKCKNCNKTTEIIEEIIEAPEY